MRKTLPLTSLCIARGVMWQSRLSPNLCRQYGTVTIHDTSIKTPDNSNPFRVPQLKYVIDTQVVLQQLRWMMQKDSMGQDIFLMGPPGPLRRWLALRYCQLVNKEVEFLSISRDTTEADIKVRREISKGNVVWINQPSVNAAIHGHILIMEGIEKAERNVLPVLNNLLENREMALDDGRFLMHPKRYDELLEIHGKEQMDKMGFLRVSPDFRVIALGLPVPLYSGTPLDPPLRSRFQCLAVLPLSTGELLERLRGMAPGLPFDVIKNLVGFMEALRTVDESMSDQDSARMFVDLTELEAIKWACMLEQFPQMPPASALAHMYPYPLLCREDDRKSKVFRDVLGKFDFGTTDKVSLDFDNIPPNGYHTQSVTVRQDRTAEVVCVPTGANAKKDPLKVVVPSGSTPHSAGLPTSSTLVVDDELEGAAHQKFASEPCHAALLDAMIMDHVMGHHICLVSENGNGKTSLVHQFGRMLGYHHDIHTIHLYADMSTRDLLQRRITLENGDTIWELTPLMQAALHGGIAVLDGVDKLKPGHISFLQRLLMDGEMALFDGSMFKSEAEFEVLKKKMNCSEEDLNKQKVFKVHRSFRVIALASSSDGLKWLQHEAQCLFTYHYIRPLQDEETKSVITAIYPEIKADDLKNLMSFAAQLKKASISENTLHPLSLRQVLRVARHLANYPGEVREHLARCMLVAFMPAFQQQKIAKVMSNASLPGLPPGAGAPAKPEGYSDRAGAQQPGVKPGAFEAAQESAKWLFSKILSKDLKIDVKDQKDKSGVTHRTVTIGDVSVTLPRADMEDASAHTLVPSVLFYDNFQHTRDLRDLLKAFKTGDHLLLVGNQGVGKNKLADRLLQLLCMPRQYIQLHRDTTVQALTVTPSVVGGIVHWEDSPLVKAVKKGHILVVDEVDKAPLEVVGVLKGLVEDKYMILADGRRIVGSTGGKEPDSRTIVMHPRFRLFALSNRPGYPFLGNDFFAVCGDLFSCHAIDNPDSASIKQVLIQYGPNVSTNTIDFIITVFSRLGQLVEQGVLSYPYSLREMVNVVRHLQKYPGDGIETALSNVFNFDVHDKNSYAVIAKLFKEYGVNLGASNKMLEGVKLRVDFSDSPAPPSPGDPKHGKVDPDNTPHHGGNQWAGGTGGTDTAGLGGRVGPYRLDAGHKVHQVSDEDKAAVPEEIKAKAKAMGKEALAKRLSEINMTKHEDTLYAKFYNDVTQQITIIKEMLKGLQSKTAERMWLRNQTDGVWDENKLVEGLTGEKAIFKRRGEDPNAAGWHGETKKKRLFFVLDCSASMYRFNGMDGRLDRTGEVAVMIMEAFNGYEDKLYYKITGHSGDEVEIPLVDSKTPPQNKNERLKVIYQMYAHAQYCWTGDNTMRAMQRAIDSITKEEGSEYFVFVISDANFQRYGIKPSNLSRTMTHSKVKTYLIFIASMWNEAQGYVSQLPAGHSFTCLDTKQLPNILKQIFISEGIVK